MPARVERWTPHKMRHRHTKERAHYTSADWRAKRQRILVRDCYTCRDCRRVCAGPDAHVDHIVPLRGDMKLFWNRGNWQTLCRHCHDVVKAAEEAAGQIG